MKFCRLFGSSSRNDNGYTNYVMLKHIGRGEGYGHFSRCCPAKIFYKFDLSTLYNPEHVLAIAVHLYVPLILSREH